MCVLNLNFIKMSRNGGLKEESFSKRNAHDEMSDSFRTCETTLLSSSSPANSSGSGEQVVILTSINADTIRMCRVTCSNCSRNQLNLYRDAQIYLNSLQLLLGSPVQNCLVLFRNKPKVTFE